MASVKAIVAVAIFGIATVEAALPHNHWANTCEPKPDDGGYFGVTQSEYWKCIAQDGPCQDFDIVALDMEDVFDWSSCPDAIKKGVKCTDMVYKTNELTLDHFCPYSCKKCEIIPCGPPDLNDLVEMAASNPGQALQSINGYLDCLKTERYCADLRPDFFKGVATCYKSIMEEGLTCEHDFRDMVSSSLPRGLFKIGDFCPASCGKCSVGPKADVITPKPKLSPIKHTCDDTFDWDKFSGCLGGNNPSSYSVEWCSYECDKGKKFTMCANMQGTDCADVDPAKSKTQFQLSPRQMCETIQNTAFWGPCYSDKDSKAGTCPITCDTTDVYTSEPWLAGKPPETDDAGRLMLPVVALAVAALAGF